MKQPVQLLKGSFIELVAGTLQDPTLRSQIEGVVARNASPEYTVDNTFISKTGSSYVVLLFVTPTGDSLSTAEVSARKSAILKELRPELPYIEVELLLT